MNTDEKELLGALEAIEQQRGVIVYVASDGNIHVVNPGLGLDEIKLLLSKVVDNIDSDEELGVLN